MCVCGGGGHCFWVMNYLLSSVDVATEFLSPEPHPDTIAFAKKLIDEMQASAPNPKISSKVPQVPSFYAPPIQQKMSAQELFGSSDSEADSDIDFRDVGGGQSDSFEEDGASPEEMYSDQVLITLILENLLDQTTNLLVHLKRENKKVRNVQVMEVQLVKLLQQAGRKRCWKIEQVFLQIHRSQFI